MTDSTTPNNRPSADEATASPETNVLRGNTADSTRPGLGFAGTGSPYHDVIFPPWPVSGWVRWKQKSTGARVSRRLWEQRERLRRQYEIAHGADKRRWPTRHPGVVLDDVLWIAHPACLGCVWFDNDGVYMRNPDWLNAALERARRHQDSGREYW